MPELLSRRSRHEVLRLALLIAVGVWITSPFLARALIGGGDAVWYHHQIADAVTQFRAGIFPVFTGQTHYGFNGAIHPLRTAPYCQYMAGLIDFLTGQRLGFHTLLNLTAMMSLVGGMVTAYVALIWISPQQRWRAAFLAWIYVAAPGTLGLPFAQDLYMSTMAVPWLPLVFAATVKMYRADNYIAPLLLGTSLAALWWAHSPIALWTTLSVALVVLVRCLGNGRSPRQLGQFIRTALPGGLAFCALASYPVVSVLTLRNAGETIVPRALDRLKLLSEIHGAFPHLLMPVSLEKPLLTFMQPGYPVLVALTIAAIASFFLRLERRRPVQVLVACAGLYLVLILPVPGLTSWLWLHFPELWVGMTNSWPMQRLSIIVAAIAVIVVQASLRSGGDETPGERRVTQLLVAACLAWSIFQAEQIRTLAHHRTRSERETELLSLEQNVNLSEYTYQQLPQRPAYFIHGVTDPRMEVRLLNSETGTLIQSNKVAAETSAEEPWIPVITTPTSNPALFELQPELLLRPGIRYLLTFDFAREDIKGILRFAGNNLQRVYVLPAAGDPKGFGTGPGQEKSLTLWTSRLEVPETARMEFISQETDGVSLDPPLLGRVRLTAIEPKNLPVEVTSLLPLQMTVRSKNAVLVETMRVSIPGWIATVDGRPVETVRSPEGLVAVSVPAGESRVEVVYRGPLILRLVFWMCVGSWVVMLLSAAVFGGRRLLGAPARPSPPAQVPA